MYAVEHQQQPPPGGMSGPGLGRKPGAPLDCGRRRRNCWGTVPGDEMASGEYANGGKKNFVSFLFSGGKRKENCDVNGMIAKFFELMGMSVVDLFLRDFFFCF